MPIDVNVAELKPLKNFGDGCPGCGTFLAMKLLLQTLDNVIIVNGTGSFTSYGRNLNVPFIHAGLNAAAVARGVARGGVGRTVVFAGDGATAINIGALLHAKEDIIYICANDQGYNSINHRLDRTFAKHLFNAAYVATASVSFPQDFITKLKKASALPGLKFIDVLTPCPALWKYEPSNTIEVGRVAVETGIWPLYEIEDGAVALTKRPNRLEPVENFNHVQKSFHITKEDGTQEKVAKSWKKLMEGHLF
ncbi:MAG TPA: thiamine pyrophosphate-dependent enzyme [archaeon]|nr:thiamine pyrophosphate-dependent enzyme [archaeon]